jgi:hypothetical protein
MTRLIVPLTALALKSLAQPTDDWSDVPDDKGYGPMRDAIVEHVKELLDRLAAH